MHLKYFVVIGFVSGAVVAAGAQAPKPQGGTPTVKDVLYSAADRDADRLHVRGAAAPDRSGQRRCVME